MEWRAVETAPEDGVMLVTDGTHQAVAFRDFGMSSYRFFAMDRMADLHFWPTHWMPLPPLPDQTPPNWTPGRYHGDLENWQHGDGEHG